MASQLGSQQSQVEITIDKTNPNINPNHNNHQEDLVKVVPNRSQEYSNSILTKFHAGYFIISLALGGQAYLWKTFIEPTQDTNEIRRILQMIHPIVIIVLWSLAFFTLGLVSLTYLLRCLFCFKLVKGEFLHHVGVNYLYVPWISCLLLLQSAPFLTPMTLPYSILWWIFAVPVLVLDIKLYGQWFTKGKRFLSAVANPTSQISVMGNLVSAQAAARMGWKEISLFLFSLGIVHYFVLFVTLYQRLSGCNRIPPMLSPMFFLFFAAPSVASVTWKFIVGSFDAGSKLLFFLSLFLFTSLICRPALFKKSMKRFNVAWWAYSFPLTALASASIEYAQEVKGGTAHVLMLLLVLISILACLLLIIITFVNTEMLLPDNDPIASILHHLPPINSTVGSETRL